MTASLPNATPGDGSPPQDVDGQSVVLQTVKPEANGRANQIWALEKETGFVFALAAEFRDRGEEYGDDDNDNESNNHNKNDNYDNNDEDSG